MPVVPRIMSSVEAVVPFADVCGESQMFRTRAAHPHFHSHSSEAAPMAYTAVCVDDNPLSPAVLLATEPTHTSVRSITFILFRGKKLAQFDHNF